MEKQTIVTILAIWGAVLSSFTVVWNLLRYHMQRGRLRISCYIGQFIGEKGSGVDSKINYLIYQVTNMGKEPVVLAKIGGTYKDKTGFLVMPPLRQALPLTLKPGEYAMIECSDLHTLGKYLKCLIAIDSLGRQWKAPKKQIKDLKQRYADGEFKEANEDGKKKTF